MKECLQPYLRKTGKYPNPEALPETDYIHHFSMYVGNHPKVNSEQIDDLCALINSI